MIDYIAIMQDYFNRGKPDDRLFLTDIPTSISLSEDAIIKVRYDAKNFRWIPFGRWYAYELPSRPSKITYPKARKLIKEIRFK